MKAIKKALDKDFTPILIYAHKHRKKLCTLFYKKYLSLNFEEVEDIFDECISLVMERAEYCAFRYIKNMESMYLSAMRTILNNRRYYVQLYENKNFDTPELDNY